MSRKLKNNHNRNGRLKGKLRIGFKVEARYVEEIKKNNHNRNGYINKMNKLKGKLEGLGRKSVEYKKLT